MTADTDIEALLARWAEQDETALSRLTPLVFEDLRRLAHHYFRHERADHTLQPTAVVNEVYLRLVGQKIGTVTTRERFFVVAARLIRQILVDHARAHRSQKRGGGLPGMSLSAAAAAASRGRDPARLLAVHEALDRLEQLDARQARVVALRYFAGLTLPEIATVLGVSLATVERAAAVAKRWLARELGPPS